jgi:adenylate kinase
MSWCIAEYGDGQSQLNLTAKIWMTNAVQTHRHPPNRRAPAASRRRAFAMTKMLIIGPPGSGKGTQAERISERLGVVAISTGDIFRANVKGETPLGIEARNYMDAGEFVPDSVTNKMVRDRLSESDVENGFLLDGYPRTTAQVDYLDGILATSEEKLDVVLQLTANDEELVARLLGRAKETGRSDDNEAVIRHRLDLYHEQTEAVVAKYAERGILTQVDGIGAIDEVTDRVMSAIKATQAA